MILTRPAKVVWRRLGVIHSWLRPEDTMSWKHDPSVMHLILIIVSIHLLATSDDHRRRLIPQLVYRLCDFTPEVRFCLSESDTHRPWFNKILHFRSVEFEYFSDQTDIRRPILCCCFNFYWYHIYTVYEAPNENTAAPLLYILYSIVFCPCSGGWALVVVNRNELLMLL